MTFREKLAKENPSKVNPACDGGCEGCPSDYDYEHEGASGIPCAEYDCTKCWNREIPGTETNKKEEDIMATTRKTKDELCIELKEAEEKIMELTKELNDAKERERLQESADKVAQMRDAFVNAGFSKEEAFKLVLISIEAALGGR